jgi:hypothetical protein
MTGEAGSPATTLLEIDPTYGGVYAGTSFEFSPAVAAHFNAAAERAHGVLEGEFRPFTAGDVFSIACPTRPLPKAEFVDAHRRLRAVIDGEVEIRLDDHPHFYSAGFDDLERFRGGPTYIPKAILPDGFLGRTHQVELFQDDLRIFGPAERFFHTATTGALFNQIEDGPGCLVLEVRGDLDVLARRGEIVVFADPAFGAPSGVVQLNDDGSSVALDWRPLVVVRVGDVTLFNEWVVLGVAPRGERLVLELRFPNKATGLAAALYSGHTRDTAFRADATIL